MHPKNIISIEMVIIISTLLSGCLIVSPGSVDRCIPSLFTYEFPVGTTPNPEKTTRKIYPTEKWQFVADLPQKGRGHYIITRSPDEIWIGGLTDRIFRYSADRKEWRIYSTINGYEMIPTSLVLTPAGTLWGIGTTGNPENYQELPRQQIPFLSRYNDKTDQFEFVRGEFDILDGYYHAEYPLMIATDRDGVLWMNISDLERQIHLYSIELEKKEVKKHIDSKENSGFSGIATIDDANIWLSDTFGERLFRYNAKTKEIQPYRGIPWLSDDLLNEDQKGFGSLYIDKANRLWVEDRGWLDISNPEKPLWHKIIRSPVFIAENSHMESDYLWLRPYDIYESSNGLFWFSSNAGMVRLDPQKGEWCLFTTDGGSITEDAKRLFKNPKNGQGDEDQCESLKCKGKLHLKQRGVHNHELNAAGARSRRWYVQ